MKTKEVHTDFLPFENFILLLQQNKFVVGVDTHIRVQVLLNHLEPNCEKEKLKRMMRPIFASSADQEIQFDELFELYFSKLPTISKTPTQTKSQTESKRTEEEKRTGISNRWIWIISGAILIIGLLVMYFMSSTLSQMNNPNFNQQDESTRILEPSLLEQIISNKWYSLAALLIIVIIILIRNWQRLMNLFNRKKKKDNLFLQSELNVKPMLYWNVKIPAVRIPIFQNNFFFQATRMFRERELSEMTMLNIPKTIQSSIRQIGFPHFEFKFKSRPPEYLFLIDRNSHGDHQAHLFEQLFLEFEKNEVHAIRFFYDDDPHLCWDEDGEGHSLIELQKKYGQHHLIIFGDADDLLDNMTGELLDWTSELLQWKNKAILSAEDPVEWMANRLHESSDFVLLRATTKNLAELSEIFNAFEKNPGKQAASKDDFDVNDFEFSSAEEIVDALKNHLSPITFQWLCACSVYPELNWNLTLYLGKQLFSEEALTEENILTLVSLPWFRKGYFPDELQQTLQQEITEEQYPKIKNLILDLLKNSPITAEDGVDDFKDYQLYIALEEAMLNPLDVEKKKNLKNLAKDLPNRESRYKEITLKFLNKEGVGGNAFTLPDWVGKLFKGNENRSKENHLYPKVAFWKLWINASPVFLFLLILELNVVSNLLIETDILLLTAMFTLYILFRDILPNGQGLFNSLWRYKVINVRTNSNCTWWQSLVRNLPITVPLLLILFSYSSIFKNPSGTIYITYALIPILLGCISILFSKSGRSWWDKIAGTQVVRVKDFNENVGIEAEEDSISFYKSVPYYDAEKASWWQRYLAWMIDASVYFLIPLFVLIFIINSILGFNFTDSTSNLIYTIMFVGLFSSIRDGFKNGQSIGKQIFELQVIDRRKQIAKGNIQFSNFQISLFRRVDVILVCLLTQFVLGGDSIYLGVLIILTVDIIQFFLDEKGLLLGDKIAKTQVVSTGAFISQEKILRWIWLAPVIIIFASFFYIISYSIVAQDGSVSFFARLTYNLFFLYLPITSVILFFKRNYPTDRKLRFFRSLVIILNLYFFAALYFTYMSIVIADGSKLETDTSMISAISNFYFLAGMVFQSIIIGLYVYEYFQIRNAQKENSVKKFQKQTKQEPIENIPKTEQQVQSKIKTEPTNSTTKPKIYFSYAQKDKDIADQIKRRLNTLLGENNSYEILSDDFSNPKKLWYEMIEEKMESVDIFLFLVSSSLMKSNFINEMVIPKALERVEENKAMLIPIFWDNEISNSPLDKFIGMEIIQKDSPEKVVDATRKLKRILAKIEIEGFYDNRIKKSKVLKDATKTSFKTYKEIQMLIAENRVEEAIDELLILTKDTALFEETIFLNGKFQRLKKDELLNIINPEDYHLQKNQIIDSILSLMQSKELQIVFQERSEEIKTSKKSKTNFIETAEKIQLLIASNEVGKAIKEMMVLTKDTTHLNEVIILNSKFQQLKKSNKSNIISDDDYLRQRNKILYSLLDLLDSLEDSEDFY